MGCCSVFTAPKRISKDCVDVWQQGFSSSDLLTEGLTRHNMEYLSGYDVRILDSNTVLPWLKQAGFDKIPDYSIFKAYNSYMANFVRIVLLKHFGGIWMDYQIILLEHMDWIQKLRQDPKVQNKHGQEPDVFMFHLPAYGSTRQYYDQSDHQTYKESPGLEISFMAAKPNSKLFNEWFEMYNEGLKNTKMYKSPIFGKKEHYISYLVEKQGVEINQMDKFGDYLIAGKCIQIILQVKQKQYDQQYQEKLKAHNLNQDSPIPQKQLSVKYYQVWSISQFEGPLILRFQTNWDNFRFSQLFAQKDIEEIKKNNLYPSYLIKANSHTFECFQGWVTPLTLLNYFFSSLQRRNVLTKRFWCPGSFNIEQNSLLNRLLIQKAAQPLNNVIIQKNPHTKLCDVDFFTAVHLLQKIGLFSLIFVLISGFAAAMYLREKKAAEYTI